MKQTLHLKGNNVNMSKSLNLHKIIPSPSSLPFLPSETRPTSLPIEIFDNPNPSKPSTTNKDLRRTWPKEEENHPKQQEQQQEPKRRRRFEEENQLQQRRCKSEQQKIPDGGDGYGGEEEEYGRRREQTSSFSFQPAGPYVPLVLSDPGSVPVVQVPASINCRLLEHQRKGVEFLYGLYKSNHGGILGDDMGLVKTIQTIAFLAVVYAKDGESGVCSAGSQAVDKGPVLIICPSSVIHNWEDEFSKWANFTVSVFHGPNRDVILDKLQARGVEVLITSFNTFRIQGGNLSSINWEIVVVDEAHRVNFQCFALTLFGMCTVHE